MNLSSVWIFRKVPDRFRYSKTTSYPQEVPTLLTVLTYTHSLEVMSCLDQFITRCTETYLPKPHHWIYI